MRANLSVASVLLFIAVFVFSSCKKDDVAVGAIELTGDQNTPLTLENRFGSLTTPDYIVTGTFSINAAVTIQPGTVIVMKPGSQIVVDGSGSLKSIGSADLPIRFTGESKAAGSWNKILIQSNNANNQFTHTIFEHGGGDDTYNATVYGYQNGRLGMNNVTIRNGRNYGFLVYSDNFVISQFSNVTVHNVQLAAIRVQASQIGAFDETTTTYSNGFNRIEIEVGTIIENTTVKKTTTPYFLRGGTLTINADLILQPGVSVVMGPSTSFSVKTSGSLKAIGTPSNIISISGEQAVQGYWNFIQFDASNNLNNEFQYCTITDGGGSMSWNGMLYLYDNSRLRIGNSTISNSQTFGILNYLSESTLVDDGNNTFTNNNAGDIGN